MKPTVPNELRIVVADDNRDESEALAKLMRYGGFAVAGVESDGKSALAAIRRELPHVAILDICMPGLNGYEIARRVRAEVNPAPRLIAISGWSLARDRTPAVSAGFDHHFPKPVNWRALELILLTCLEVA